MTILQQRILNALTAFDQMINEGKKTDIPSHAEMKRLIKEVKTATLLEPLDPRYRCPECDTLLDEGERRCDSCNKFGARVDLIMICPHCEEPITGEE